MEEGRADLIERIEYVNHTKFIGDPRLWYGHLFYERLKDDFRGMDMVREMTRLRAFLYYAEQD